MVGEILVCVLLVVVLVGVYVAKGSTTKGRRTSDPHAWRRISEAKQIVHIRGSGRPGQFKGVFCSAEVKTIPKDKNGDLLRDITATQGCSVHCEFVDSSMRYWCRFHVPKDAAVLERAVAEGDGFADGVCAAHGIDCPKPWSLA